MPPKNERLVSERQAEPGDCTSRTVRGLLFSARLLLVVLLDFHLLVIGVVVIPRGTFPLDVPRVFIHTFIFLRSQVMRS